MKSKLKTKPSVWESQEWRGVNKPPGIRIVASSGGVHFTPDGERMMSPATARMIAEQLLKAAEFALEQGCHERFME